MPAAPVPPSIESTPVSASVALHHPDSPLISDLPPLSAPYISLIGAAAFVHACKLPRAMNFTLYICAEDAKLHSTSASPPVNTPNLSSVPQEYHDFADIFSKAKATMLTLHQLGRGASPPLGTVYSLSQTELGVLRTFINKHLSYGFIQQFTSAHGAPVLFIRKKDGSLHLCVNY